LLLQTANRKWYMVYWIATILMDQNDWFLYTWHIIVSLFCYFAHGSSCEILWWSRLCLPVSPRGYLPNHTRDIYQFLYMLPMAMARSSSSGEKAILGVLLPRWQCIVHHSIWDPNKNSWTDQDVIWDGEWTWPAEQCVTWGWRSPKGKGQFWGEMCLTSLIPIIIVNWTGPCSSTQQGQTFGYKHWTCLLSATKRGVLCFSGWHHVFYNGLYSDMNVTAKDRFRLNLLICDKVGQNSISCY